MKSRKRKNKGGRPRKEGPREADGRRDRKFVAAENAEAAKAITVTATEARQRIYGMTKDQARDPRATSVIGRMEMQGRLTRHQTDAAQRYLEIRNAYQRAMGITPEYVEPRREGPSGFSASPEAIVAHARTAHDDMDALIAEVCTEEKTMLPRKALDVIVVRDIEMPPLDGVLRLVLNRLHRGLFAERKRRAA